jgi:hypothetical protein
MQEEHTWDTGATQRTRAIEQVREGMTVVDATGEELGTVELVRMGDPQAVTTRGNVRQTNDLMEIVAKVFTGAEPSLSEAKREQLVRYGFIKIDGPGLTDTDRYVRSDKIREVSGETVVLAVSKDQLPTED